VKPKVEFKISNKTVDWDDRFLSILELAQEAGVEIETDCEQGLCGTCKVKLLSGEVDMETDDGLDEAELEQNMILPCVAVPKTDVVLEV
jgi:ferredoxin